MQIFKKTFTLIKLGFISVLIVLVSAQLLQASYSSGKPLESTSFRINSTRSKTVLTITGKVTDQNNLPIPGVIVKVKGGNQTALTNTNGAYSISVADASAVLVFSYVGYQTNEQMVGTKTTIDVTLIETDNKLNEVVVVGYGTQKRANVTGAVARADLQAFKDAPNTTIGQSLQGTVPGLNVGPVTGAGNNPSITVRGKNTLAGSTNVLIILDGIQYTGALSSINPDDIESIDVLKDASSTAVYGAQAANGVILITSRKGNGKPRINFSSSYATQTPSGNIHPMRREEYLNYVRDLNYTKAFLGPAYTEPNPAFDIVKTIDAGMRNTEGLLPNDFDWYGEATKTGFVNDNQLSVSGGSDNVNYLISAGFTNQAGFIINDRFKRKSLRVNLESKVNSWIKLGLQSFATFNNQDGAEPDLGSIFRLSPLLVPYDASGNLIINPFVITQDANPFLSSDIDDLERRNFYFANLYSQVDFPFLKGLSYRINFGNNGRTELDYQANKYGASQTGSASKDTRQYYDYTIDNILTYTNKFDKHSITGTLLYGASERKEDYTSASATGFTRLTLGYNNLSLGAIQKTSSDAYREALNYQMARVNYAYNDRYLFTGTLRRDGYSAFAQNYKYAIFPSASLGWILSEEPFFKAAFVNSLKIRVGYGVSGNQVDRYSSIDKVDASGITYIYGDGNANTQFGQRLARLANPDLKWEKTYELNLGADFTLLNNRLSGSLDVYSRKTNELLYDVNIPNITGFTTIKSNVGRVDNKGVELSLTSRNMISGDFKWSTTFNFSKNSNKIKELLGSGDLVNSGLFIGQPSSAIFDYVTNGIYQIGETIPAGYSPGTYRVVDTNEDGLITTADRVITGYKDPAYRFSFLNTLQYRNFTLTAFINSIQGGKSGYLGNNSQSLILSDNNNRWNNVSGVDFWSPSNPNGEYPRSLVSPTLNPAAYRDRSFVRLQDITLSYKFSEKLMQKIGTQSLSIFVSGKNLATWTKWKGWDPEISDGGLNIGGRPLLKGYSFGLNLTL